MSQKLRQEIYYKVVQFDYLTNKLYSFCAPSDVQIEYVPKKFVKSKCIGKLCCFKSEESARNFLGIQCYGCLGISKYQIWECKIGKSYHNSYIPMESGFGRTHIQMNIIETLIRRKKKFLNMTYRSTCVFPFGTIFTDKIMLIKQLPFYSLSNI